MVYPTRLAPIVRKRDENAEKFLGVGSTIRELVGQIP